MMRELNKLVMIIFTNTLKMSPIECICDKDKNVIFVILHVCLMRDDQTTFFEMT